MSVDGILNVNKPKGKTSYSVVAWLKRLSGEKHVGHAGTLDPLATGVLPVCFGQSTKVIQFLMNSSKTYSAKVRLGVTTDTYDSDGKIISSSDITNITREQVEEALASFQGFIKQTPPVYSALKHRGWRYYELARSGISVEPKVRQVQIFSIKLMEWSPPFLVIEVKCGKGTYTRSIAHELGQALGCGACVADLVRLTYGPFHIDQAVSLLEIETAFNTGSLTQFLFPLDAVLLSWSALVVTEEREFLIKNGCPLPLFEELPFSSEYRRVYAADGRFIAVLRFSTRTGLWHPIRIFSQ